MKRAYITITGTNHYYGNSFFRNDMTVILEKEPENPFDNEAIMVKLPGLGKIGYVANSVHTVAGECMSAGRLYDKIGMTASASVFFVLDEAVICAVDINEMETNYGA